MSDSISLYAVNAYNRTLNQEIPKMDSGADPMVSASSFQDMVKVNFNGFASLTPNEILQKINVSRNEGSVNSSPAFTLDLNSRITKSVAGLRDVLSNHETQSRKAAIGEGNFVDLMSSTIQAQNSLTTLTTLRDKVIESWDKILNMSI